MRKIMLILLGICLLSSFVIGSVDDAYLYYTFDDVDLDAGNPKDVSGNDRHGVNVGATTGVSGIINEQFSYDGINDRIEFPTISKTATGGLCGVYTFGISPTYIFTITSSTTTNTEVIYCYLPDDELTCGLRTGGITKYWEFTTNSANLVTDTPYHICLTNDGTEPDIIINGVDKAKTFGTSVDKTMWTDDLTGTLSESELGHYSLYFNGSIDEVAYYEHAVTVTDAQELYNGGDYYNPYYVFNKFILNAYDLYNDTAVLNFTADIINSTTSEEISTVNGTVYWDKEQTINISVFNNINYHKRNVYNINSSNNLNLSLYRHELYSPSNGYVLNDSEDIDFIYNVSDKNGFTNCSLIINSTFYNQTLSISNGLNILNHAFNQNGTYEWWVECNGIESESRYLTVLNVSGPEILSYSPSQYISIYEGNTTDFEVIVSSPISYIIQWFKDGISQTFGSLWSWIVGGSEQGDNRNITVIVTDAFNQTDSFEWTVNVTNVNLAPVVSDIGVSLDSIFENLDYSIYCDINDSDTNSPNISVDIQWSDDGSNWNDVIEYYVSGVRWASDILNGTHNTGDSISYRCRGTDNETIPLTSAWYYVTDYREIGITQTAPETPSILLPKYAQRKYTIPVVCAGSYDAQQDIQTLNYEVEIRKNETVWELIRNATELVSYSYSIADDGFNTTYDLRCRTHDGVEYSDYAYNYNATIKTDVPVFSIMRTMDNPTYIDKKPYTQGYFIDVSALGDDYSVYKVTGECNDDGLIDYVKDHNYAQSTKGVFTCINKAGLYLKTIDAYIYKNNTDEKWLTICKGLDATEQYCKLSKKYEVRVYE